MQTIVYTKVAAAGDGGKTVRFSMDAAAKYTLTVAAYTGDMLAPQFAKALGDRAPGRPHHPDRRGRRRRLGGVLLGRQVLGDDGLHAAGRGHRSARRSAAPTPAASAASWPTPARRVPAGTYGGLTATADAASANATMWTILLRQAG